MPVWQIVGLALIFLLVDLTIISVVFHAVGGELRSLSQRFPASPPRHDAVRREFQSFRIGMVGLGKCVHVAVDENHLHLFPAWIARRMGMKALSVPWEQVELRGKGLSGMKARFGTTDVIGPPWCLELARPPAPPPEGG